MAIEKSLVSGSMTMLILKLLSEKDMYGYETDRCPATEISERV